MADEMLTKNFVEQKKSNQKRVFVYESTEDQSKMGGKSNTFEELMESLTE